MKIEVVEEGDSYDVVVDYYKEVVIECCKVVVIEYHTEGMMAKGRHTQIEALPLKQPPHLLHLLPNKITVGMHISLIR